MTGVDVELGIEGDFDVIVLKVTLVDHPLNLGDRIRLAQLRVEKDQPASGRRRLDVVVDQIVVNEESRRRLTDSISTALKHGKGSVMLLEKGKEQTRHFSQHLMCPTSGISYDEPAPNNFSFNSPYGACRKCNGLGTIPEIDLNSVIPDKKLFVLGDNRDSSDDSRSWGLVPFENLEGRAVLIWCSLDWEKRGRKLGFPALRTERLFSIIN